MLNLRLLFDSVLLRQNHKFSLKETNCFTHAIGHICLTSCSKKENKFCTIFIPDHKTWQDV